MKSVFCFFFRFSQICEIKIRQQQQLRNYMYASILIAFAFSTLLRCTVHLTEIADSSPFQYGAKSLAHSSLQHLSSSIRLDGKHRCPFSTHLTRDVQSDSNLGSGCTLALCLGLKHLKSRVLWSGFSSRMSLFTAALISPSTLTSLPVPARWKNILTAWCGHLHASL